MPTNVEGDMMLRIARSRFRAGSGLLVPLATLPALFGCGQVETPAGGVPADEVPLEPISGSTSGPTPGAVGFTAVDLADVLAAAARHRVLVDNSFGGEAAFTRVDVVDTIGITDDAGMLDARVGRALRDAERDAIAGALAPLPVGFVPASVFESLDPAEDPGGRVIVTLGEPEQMDGRLVIASQLWCGGLCGVGGANELVRAADGTWSIAEPVGGQWMS
ncbi:MAG: hypothetical protein ACLGHQ_01720 [Acidimicrobiia bacterium]